LLGGVDEVLKCLDGERRSPDRMSGGEVDLVRQFPRILAPEVAEAPDAD